MNSRTVLLKTKNSHPQAKFLGDGVLLVDKPEGLTSNDIVQKVKKKLRAAKVGHSGTLDPFATGVLILLINEATKLSPFLANQKKTYRFTLVFGVETDTQDGTGKVLARLQCGPLQKNAIEAACAAFTGEIEQAVPQYSAVRIGGQRLYRLARRGVKVPLPRRAVKIESLSLCGLSWPKATFEVTCSKGTYVRSLGVDLARHLNCNGHVAQLRRLRSGTFHLAQCLTLRRLDEVVKGGELDRVLVSPVRALADYPEVRVSHPTARRIRQGFTLDSKDLPCHGIRRACWWPEGPHKIVDPDANLVAMVVKSAQTPDDGMEKEVTFKTLRVFRDSLTH